MTHLVPNYKYPTKKSFKAAVLENPAAVYLEDPSFINPSSGTVKDLMAAKKGLAVTNDPKRSWFAAIELNSKGQIVVK